MVLHQRLKSHCTQPIRWLVGGTVWVVVANRVSLWTYFWCALKLIQGGQLSWKRTGEENSSFSMEWQVSVGLTVGNIVSLKPLSSITPTCIVTDHFLHVLWVGSEQSTRKTSPWEPDQKELVSAQDRTQVVLKAIEEIQLPWQIMLLRRPIITLARMSWNGAMKKVRTQCENHW